MHVIVNLKDARILSKNFRRTPLNLVHACLLVASLWDKGITSVDISIKGGCLGADEINAILNTRGRDARIARAAETLEAFDKENQ